MLDCQLYGLQPWGHHLTNVLLQSAAAILLFLALWTLTGACWPSAFVAALFAIHPLRVESVAWIAERKDVLSGVFFMLTLWAYARYVRSPRFSGGRYSVVIGFYAMGLMCKPTLVTVPFVLLLLDYWPLQRFVRSAPVRNQHPLPNQVGPVSRSIGYLLVEKVPFLVLAVLSCVATLLAQERAVITLRQLTFPDRVTNAIVSYVVYIGQMFWPAHLAVVYPYPQAGWTVVQVILALIVLVAITALFFAARSNYSFLLVGWFWFLGMLVPMIGLIQVGMQCRADRYTYLAQIGLYVLVTWGAIALLKKWPRGREVSIGLAVAIISGLMAAAFIQTSVWRDSITMWEHTLANTNNNYVAQTHFGEVLTKNGRLDEAITHLRQAVAISDYPSAHYNLGYALASKGDWADATVSFRSAIRVRPNYPPAHSNLAVSLSKLGSTDEALMEFGEALRLDNDYRDAHRNLAVLQLELGRRDEAVVHFREALRLKPDDPAVREQLRQLGAEQ